MNDIQRQYLLIIGILALCCLGVYKLAEIIVFLLQQLGPKGELLLLIAFAAFIFKLKFDAYRRKGGE